MSTPREEPIVIGSREWDALTERRAELIYRKNREGLTAAELEEFTTLQRKSREAVSGKFKPGLPDLEGRLEALEKSREAGSKK